MENIISMTQEEFAEILVTSFGDVVVKNNKGEDDAVALMSFEIMALIMKKANISLKVLAKVLAEQIETNCEEMFKNGK